MNNNHSSRGIFAGVGGSRRQKHSSTAGAVEGLRRLAPPEATAGVVKRGLSKLHRKTLGTGCFLNLETVTVLGELE